MLETDFVSDVRSQLLPCVIPNHRYQSQNEHLNYSLFQLIIKVALPCIIISNSR